MNPRTDTLERSVAAELHIKTRAIPDWSELARIREHVALAVAGLSEAVRDAAVMVASELVENAIKYGESVPGAPGIEVSVALERNELSITVVNGIDDEEAAGRLLGHVEALASSNDKFELYVARVRHLADAPEPRARLGLYRIGLEGAFDLKCIHERGVLRMVATRTLQ